MLSILSVELKRFEVTGLDPGGSTINLSFCPQAEAFGRGVHETVARESQRHPADRQGRHAHPGGEPAVQEAGQWFVTPGSPVQLRLWTQSFCQEWLKVSVPPLQIMREIAEHKIKIYEFPETDDEEENRLVKKIKVLTPGDSQHSEVPHCVRHNNTIITQ